MSLGGMGLGRVSKKQKRNPMEKSIKLDQFLKREGVVFSGGEAKHLIQSGAVSVNGEVETRRGRKLHEGDIVTLEDVELAVGPLIEES
jgi:ribosome-associated protein